MSEQRWNNDTQVTGGLKNDVKKERSPSSVYNRVQLFTLSERAGRGTQPGSHLASELTDALACLQDGDLHLFRGLVGMSRLLQGKEIKHEARTRLAASTPSLTVQIEKRPEKRKKSMVKSRNENRRLQRQSPQHICPSPR